MHDTFFHLKSISFIFSKHLLSGKIIFCISKWAFYSFSLFFPPSFSCVPQEPPLRSFNTDFLQAYCETWVHMRLFFHKQTFHFLLLSIIIISAVLTANQMPAHTQKCKWMHIYIHAAYHNLKVIMNASKSASLFLYHLKKIILAAYSECALSVSNSVEWKREAKGKRNRDSLTQTWLTGAYEVFVMRVWPAWGPPYRWAALAAWGAGPGGRSGSGCYTSEEEVIYHKTAWTMSQIYAATPSHMLRLVHTGESHKKKMKKSRSYFTPKSKANKNQ